MSKSKRAVTKNVVLPIEFSQAAAIDPVGALAYMFLLAEGFPLEEGVAYCEKMLRSKDEGTIQICLTAGVQIRGNTVFAAPVIANLKANYPLFIIDGQREQADSCNFSAMHICGHLLLHGANHPIAARMLKKVGSCITGRDCPDNEAGQINSEIASSWSPDARRDALDAMDAMSVDITSYMDSVQGKASTFREYMAGSKSAPRRELEVPAGGRTVPAPPPPKTTPKV